MPRIAAWHADCDQTGHPARLAAPGRMPIMGLLQTIHATPEGSIVTTSYAGSAGDQPAPSGFAVSERTARLRAEAALFMRDHVLSLVSHDLRGPLNAIHSWAYVLERKLDANDANAQRAVTGIRNGVDQQVKLRAT